MLAALGALIPELLDLSGTFHFVEPVWWRVCYSKLQAGKTLSFVSLYIGYCCFCICFSKESMIFRFSFSSSLLLNLFSSLQQGDTLDYLGIPGLHIAGSQGVIVEAIYQVPLMVGPEYARYCGIEALEPLGIYLPGHINYPGGTLFDPLNLSKDPCGF